MIIKLIILILSVGSILFCKAKPASNLNVSMFEGYTLNGESLRLSDSKHKILALNVYSPTCVPCIKEIPALNYIYSVISEKNLGEFYIAVDPYSIIEDSESLSFEEVRLKASDIMKSEAEKRSIQLPILIMKKPFTVEPKQGLITGTPETLLFKTNPLVLFYNFIGPISEKDSLEEIQSDGKVIFFLKMFGGF